MSESYTTTKHPTPWREIVIVLLVCAVAFFARLGDYGIIDLDEGLYAESAREMALSGNWITPKVNGQPFFEKPPLVYWQAAACIKVLGRSELAIRLPSAIAMTLIALLILLAGARLRSTRAGLFGAIALAVSPIPFAAGRLLTTDATLTLWVSVALLCWWKVRWNSASARSIPWMAGLGASMGMGVLAKGLPGVAIPIAVVIVHEIVARRAGDKPSTPLPPITAWLAMAGALMIVAVPWHVLANRASGEAFWSEYVVRQHLQRFKGGDTAHKEPFWFFVPGLLAGFFPWSLMLPAAWLGKLGAAEKSETANAKSKKQRKDKAEIDPDGVQPLTAIRFLKVWAVVVFLMFSVSGSKLISYILPMYPACALLVGLWLDRSMNSLSSRRMLIWTGGVAAAIASALFVVAVKIEAVGRWYEATYHRSARIEELPPMIIPFLQHLFIAVAIFAIATCVFAVMKQIPRATYAFAGIGASIIGVGVLDGIPAINSFSSDLHSIAKRAARELERGTTGAIFLSSPRRPSVLFYLPDATFKEVKLHGYCIRELSEPYDVGQFLIRNRPSVVITSVKRAEELTTLTPTIIWPERSGDFALVEATVTPVTPGGNQTAPAPSGPPGFQFNFEAPR
jgi:4-amino-4-deoxy-L-arabinose transferase-like glycosyltransferase